MSLSVTEQRPHGNHRRRWLMGLGLLLLVAGIQRCDGDPVGTLKVDYHLQREAGIAQSCEDLGAVQVELSLWAQPEDQVPLDVATLDCDAADSGRSTFAIVVTAGSYHTAQLRFLTANGNTVQICTSQGRVPAAFEQTDITVSRGEVRELVFSVIGESGVCAP
ncbi:MAG: hypothetical protein ABI333_12030 [bacterium]